MIKLLNLLLSAQNFVESDESPGDYETPVEDNEDD